MQLFDHDESDDSDIVFRDLILLMLTGFVTVAVLMLAHINPKAAKAAAEGSPAPGNVIVEATWPPGMDTDVDLWVQAPGDVPVGYSNKGGLVFNLLRDDLGHQMDVSGINYEVAYSRGVVGGEYTVNLHEYRNRAKTNLVPVTVVVSVKPQPTDPSRQILMSKVELTREGEEHTVFRFRLDTDGALVPGSVNSLQRPLRSGVKS
ncbi:MAG: hypothetical protein U1E45_19520 [Geminicoccaceae bacterium]